jgi:hypothetical protein
MTGDGHGVIIPTGYLWAQASDWPHQRDRAVDCATIEKPNAVEVAETAESAFDRHLPVRSRKRRSGVWREPHTAVDRVPIEKQRSAAGPQTLQRKALFISYHLPTRAGERISCSIRQAHGPIGGSSIQKAPSIDMTETKDHYQFARNADTPSCSAKDVAGVGRKTYASIPGSAIEESIAFDISQTSQRHNARINF